MSAPKTPIEVFCSYAPADARWQRKLETHMSLMQRQGLITSWQNRQLVAGTDWTSVVDTHLNSATIILLLISTDFLASDYCYGIEMQRALQRHQAGQARVIPILLRSVADWQEAPFGRLSALPTN